MPATSCSCNRQRCGSVLLRRRSGRAAADSKVGRGARCNGAHRFELRIMVPDPGALAWLGHELAIALSEVAIGSIVARAVDARASLNACAALPPQGLIDPQRSRGG